MSLKNFVSYGDAETILTSYANEVAGKVDKVTGKGLSTEDYTTAEKTKLANMTSLTGTIYTDSVKDINGKYLLEINSGTSVDSMFYFYLEETIDPDELVIANITSDETSALSYKVILYPDPGDITGVTVWSSNFTTALAYLHIIFYRSTQYTLRATVKKQSPTKKIYITVQRLKVK